MTHYKSIKLFIPIPNGKSRLQTVSYFCGGFQNKHLDAISSVAAAAARTYLEIRSGEK